MTDTEIRPALTAEEWKDFRDSRSEAAVAIMGLANASLPDDDPRKITREDVALVENAACVVFLGGNTSMNALAAKLAALLPPGHG